MILMDKEAENSEKVSSTPWQSADIMYNGGILERKNYV
jgi:hypothetical protein